MRSCRVRLRLLFLGERRRTEGGWLGSGSVGMYAAGLVHLSEGDAESLRMSGRWPSSRSMP
jgi:hypothetical protein